MQIAFFRSRTIGSWLIRLITWSDWSHVALVEGDMAIEATWPRVRRVPLAEIVATHAEHVLVDVPAWASADILAAARRQIGKPYDWTALFGILLHRDWQEQDAWFCSELVAWAFGQAGAPLFRPEAMHRVTPQHLWMLPEKSN